MLLEKGKKIALIVGTVVLPGLVVGSVFVATNNTFNMSKADTYSITLNNDNQPTLTNGEGTMTDDKNVTWEYHNASANANGHVTLNSDSYFGVSSSTTWAITAISSVTVTFTGNELWLLKSVDGITWHEVETLTSGQACTGANNWRYIRFYSYASTINVTSVIIGYSCTGTTPTDDVDGAVVGNVVTTSGLTASQETTSVSPNSVGGEAVRFTKNQGANSTSLTLGFGKTYTLRDVAYQKVEFDIWTQNINYGRTIELLNSDGSYTSSKITAPDPSKPASVEPLSYCPYVWTSLGNNWYHIDLPMSPFVSLISGYDKDDIPSNSVLNSQFDAIRINAGNCVIDNLRLGSSACDLGNYNSATYVPTVGKVLWIKTSWVGKLYPEDVQITFDDDTMAERILLTDPKLKNGSPFYVRLLAAGTVTVTVSVVSGYNRRTQTVSRTFSVT